jgi:diphthamide biosynthesis enzyme Dph1/Dph2-like protein
MDLLHIEARYTQEIDLPQSFIDQLPEKVALFTTVQFLNSKEHIIKQLEDQGRKVQSVRPRHAKYDGQILGCSTTTFDLDEDAAFVYIGDGLFHPKALVLRNDRKVFMYDPKRDEQGWLTQDSVRTVVKKVKGEFIKFLMSKNIGILVTLKPGQNKEYMTKKLEEQYPDKNFYYFAAHTINFGGLVDFPFIDIFLNTMCERIGSDDMDVQGLHILNIEDLWDMRDGVFDHFE